MKIVDMISFANTTQNFCHRDTEGTEFFCLVLRKTTSTTMDTPAQGMEHAGVIWGEQADYSIGDWVKYLRLVHEVQSAEEMINAINYVFYVD